MIDDTHAHPGHHPTVATDPRLDQAETSGENDRAAATGVTPRTLLGATRRALAERFAAQPAWVLLTQLFIGLGWLRAALQKLTDPDWWTGEGVSAFVTSNLGESLGWYLPFTTNLVLPSAAMVAFSSWPSSWSRLGA